MTLHADTVNGDTGSLHLLYHVVDFVAFGRDRSIVVIVEQQRIGIGLTGKLESLANKLVTARNGLPLRRTQRVGCIGIIGYGLVNNVPAVNDIAITLHYGINVSFHPLIEFLLAGLYAVT
ncbi:MAG: hypothetical protein BWY95_02105 [Bacteroidetes bacterium ADurb.BinA104]|nr:MAG: hypothetical protein BWY95_02105 [Bacteroidetes bacterium ADurb.BinA104]